MKKVLLITRPICPPWDEASKNFAYYLAKNIKDLNIGLLTCGTIPDLLPNIEQKPIYTSNHLSFWQKIKLSRSLGKLKKEFDIFHSLFTPTKQNSSWLKKILKKDVKTIQTIATLREDLYSDEDLKKMIFADLAITYSDYALNKLNTLGIYNAKRVYPGIDLELYRPMEKDAELMKNLEINSDDFVLTYHGEFTRLGSIDDMAELVEKYQTEFREKKIKLVLACRIKNDADRKKKKKMLENFKAKNLLDIVRLPETFTMMEKVYNLGDIALFPVHHMQGKFDIPLVIPEAFACGKPMIISDLPILEELISGGEAVTIEKGNVENIFEEIMALYNDSAKRKEMGEKGRKYVEANFDIKKVAETYQEIYENL